MKTVSFPLFMSLFKREYIFISAFMSSKIVFLSFDFLYGSYDQLTSYKIHKCRYELIEVNQAIKIQILILLQIIIRVNIFFGIVVIKNSHKKNGILIFFFFLRFDVACRYLSPPTSKKLYIQIILFVL